MMTDAIDTLNDEINGGMGVLSNMKMPKEMSNVGLGKGATVVGKGLGKGLGKGGSIVSKGFDAYRKSDFYVVLFTVNFLLRLCLVLFSPLFNKKKLYVSEYKKHIKESFGVTLISSIIFYYIYYFSDFIDKNELRGENEDCIQFTIFTLILFSIFMYDYVNIVLMLVNKKFFSAKTQNQGILSGIMIAIIFGIFVLYYFTIVISNGLILSEPKTIYPLKLGSMILLLLFTLSFFGFIIININEIDFNEENPIKAIFGSLMNLEENRLNNNNKDRKEFFINMFKKYYMIFILISCILLVVLDLNKQAFYDFVQSKLPCPPTT
tara:strand:+ start:4082 stop:5044 length:963 start_codon:yes stop_codon:yes gene_type:complete